jgi:hypothetical protein
MRDSNVPQSALVVNIYGGACAGTIYAMTQSYYLSIKGARKVFSIWIPPAWDIRNCPTQDIYGNNFLPQAWDDTFSNNLPDLGYNSKGQLVRGLSNPDLFMINHGYNFLWSNNNIKEMAIAIYEEATK